MEKYKVALPLHAEWGTQPNVFYVPPTSPSKYDSEGRDTGEQRIPLEYLESLFGPTTGEALATLARERQAKAEGRDSELMDTLIGFKHAEMFKLS